MLPDELDKLSYPPDVDPISVRATYLNRRQIERHQALLDKTWMPERLAEIAKGKKSP